MTSYEELLAEYTELDIMEQTIKNKGLYADGCVWIKKGLREVEKLCVLAEEIGHHETTVGNILDQSAVGNRKQEEKARRWAYEKLISRDAIEDAYALGYTEPHEIADHIGVSEEFLKDCIEYHQIRFEPERKTARVALAVGGRMFYAQNEQEILQILGIKEVASG